MILSSVTQLYSKQHAILDHQYFVVMAMHHIYMAPQCMGFNYPNRRLFINCKICYAISMQCNNTMYNFYKGKTQRIFQIVQEVCVSYPGAFARK